MADNTKNEVNGIRFQLLNIEDVDPKDYVPHELFAKGENDLVMIDSNCKPFPFLDFIIKKLNQKVGLNHLNTSEAHAIVDSKTSGFMSSSLYDLLNKNTNTISELAYEIGVNRSKYEKLFQKPNKQFQKNNTKTCYSYTKEIL